MRATKEFEIIHTVGKRIKSEHGINKFKILSIDEFTGFIFKETESEEFKPFLLLNHFKAVHKVVSKKDKNIIPLSIIYFADDFVQLINAVLMSKFNFKFSSKPNPEILKPLLDIYEDEEYFFSDSEQEESEIFLYGIIANRCAVRIEPNKLFIDWLNYTFEGYVDKSNDVLNATTYLIKDADEIQLLENRLKRNYALIFELQLNNYCTDESLWPQKRTYAIFKKWFNISFSDEIIDLENGPIEMI
jgi:hypothetical protein